MLRFIISLLLLVLAVAVPSLGKTPDEQDDLRRSWAVDVQVGGNLMQHSRLQGAEVPVVRMGPSGNNGLLTKLHVEKYLAGGHFSAKLGYEHEEVNLLEGDYSDGLSELMLGGRWYPVPGKWQVQPYMGADFLWNLNSNQGDFDMASTSAGYTYSMYGHGKMPRFSLGPVVGVDLYIFSCIALQVEYGYRWAIDARVNGHYTDTSRRTADRHARVNRHALTLGLKVAFPFSFSRHDAKGLFDLLFGDD